MLFFKQYIEEFFGQADEELKAKAIEILANKGIIIDPETLFNDVELENMQQSQVKDCIDSLEELEEEHLAENTSYIKKFKNFK